MDVARTVLREMDLDAELVAAYPLLARRLTVVLHDPNEAQDVAQSAFARALERRSRFRGGDVRAWLYANY
jgi:DNA-directed RNA polymerase specialized sigma24 family protein